MTAETRLLLMLALPLLTAGMVILFGRRPNLREAVQLVMGTALFAVATSLAGPVFGGARPTLRLGQFVPGFVLTLQLEPLGMLLALLAAGLWVITTAYAMGYMRAHRELHQSRFFMCFSVAIFATMGAALAGDLLTLFIFYEILTFSTYPLVTHHGTDAARRGGRTYLTILVATSIGLLLTAIGWTWQLAGTLEFRPGGVFHAALAEGRIGTAGLAVLLGLFAFGAGKAALMPVHGWLPAAMVAPTPVSALLHAVAVVKVGVFTVLKVVIYIFGSQLLRTTGISVWLMYAAGASVLLASLMALAQDNLKARLAYSTVSQLSYVTLGAALATPASLVGAGMHLVMHAMGKITLFFCAGAIYVTTHKTNVSEMRGLGRTMPLTMAAFFLSSLSIIGLPPCGGTWSKWLLVSGAAAAEQPVFVAVLIASSLLNVAYLLPVAVAGFYGAAPHDDGRREDDPPAVSPAADTRVPGAARGWHEAPLLCVVPLCLTALGGVYLFFFADKLFRLLEPLGRSSGL
jgi:multicomponent Na+:H+ antiporter subunit D